MDNENFGEEGSDLSKKMEKLKTNEGIKPQKFNLTATKNLHQKFETIPSIDSIDGKAKRNQNFTREEESKKRNESGKGEKEQEQTLEFKARRSKEKERKKRTIYNAGIDYHITRQVVFAPQFDTAEYQDHVLKIYKGLQYSVNSLKGPSDKYLKAKQVSLSGTSSLEFIILEFQKTLVLDLDETLIHSVKKHEDADYQIKVMADDGSEVVLRVNMRPHCRDFLEVMSHYYEIIVFTAASLSYANVIVNFLDPESRYISGVLSRSQCLQTKNGFYIKDLRLIKNRELKNMIIIDNLVHSFGLQIDNGVPIFTYKKDKADKELKYLVDYLIEASFAEDIREFNRERLKLMDLAKVPEEYVFDKKIDVPLK